MEAAKRYYYELMGWDGDGTPKAEKLVELGLDEFL
jgi:aldehyde:ferredoxin oxidoreductase